jgi:hypothetical protein
MKCLIIRAPAWLFCSLKIAYAGVSKLSCERRQNDVMFQKMSCFCVIVAYLFATKFPFRGLSFEFVSSAFCRYIISTEAITCCMQTEPIV